MKVEVVSVRDDPKKFTDEINALILRLQQAGASEFTIQYQLIHKQATPPPNLVSGGGGTYLYETGKIIYTALITYK